MKLNAKKTKDMWSSFKKHSDNPPHLCINDMVIDRGTEFKLIARNRGHFAPVINCQRNLVFKMADKVYTSQGKRIPYDILNNLSSVDLFYEEKGKKKTSSKKILGVYQAERLIGRKQDADVSKTVPH